MGAQKKWKLVSPAEPCKICNTGDWCQTSADDSVAMCMRVSEGAFRIKQTASGAIAHFHELIPRDKRSGSKPVTVEPDGQRADADTLHAVYSAMLEECPCSESHCLELLKRKAPLPFSEMKYGTLKKEGRGRFVAKLRERFGDADLLRVPGFVLKVNGKGERYIGFNGKTGLMIPVRDDLGRIVGIKIRVDGATSGGGGKYTWASSRKSKYLPFEGPGPGTVAHCPMSIKERPVRTVRVTEGPLKADVATNNSEIPTIAADSVGNWSRVLALVEQLKPATVRIAFDMDRKKNPLVAGALVKLARNLMELEVTVEIEVWPDEHKGIDDALVAGAAIEVITGDVVTDYLSELIGNTKADNDEDRVEIEVSIDEHKTNDDAIKALANDSELYQRGGGLVWIVRGEKRKDGIRRPDDVPLIVPLKLATIRERLSRVCRFGVTVITDEGPKFERKPIPQRCVEAVASRGHWPGIRVLEGVVTSPILRPDGTILNVPGYDDATGLVFDSQGTVYSIPERPTRDDAIAAAGRLLDLVSDFPFVTQAHKSAWLAGLLTPLARHAFDGPAPLFLFDANIRGAGKTMLAELISLILTGGDFSRMNNPQDDAECRKLITSLVLCGDPLVLIDNIEGVLGCAALDAALTGTSWKDRGLGTNNIIRGRLMMTWFASGNNVILNGDSTRRICQVRLESPEEKPEERTSFKYPNLTEYIRDNRSALLVDALTVLSAYCIAGKPQSDLKPWGSFCEWSNLVRQCFAWLDLADPGETRQELAARSDRDAENLRELIAGWEEIDLDCTGLTCADALERLKNHPNEYTRLRNVLANVYDLKPGELPGAKKLGNRLRHFRKRVCGGKAFDDTQENRNGVKVWRIVNLANRTGAKCGAGSADSADSLPSLLTRDEEAVNCNGIHDAHAHKYAIRGETDAADNADPAVNVPTFEAGHAGLLKHKRAGCQSLTGWHHVNGEDVCFTCWPPTDIKAVVR